MAKTKMTGPKKLVFDPDEAATFDCKVAAAHDAHRITPRGPVKRLSNRRPPIDDHRFAILVGHREPTNVKALKTVRRFCGAVDSPKDQRSVAEIQIGQPFYQSTIEGVPLETRLKGPTKIGLMDVAEPPSRAAADIEAIVCMVNKVLLVAKFRVLLGHNGVKKCYRGLGRLGYLL